MTPREIELLTIAKLEHEGHQLTQADQREIHRSIQSSIAYRAKYRSIMTSPVYQWKKPKKQR
ncbi:hypothetical protein V1954_20670 [Yersinia sp. 2538 StPb PI]|uniref:hypothetical protein n=1 Tax=Yersinia TaxID=629 RepID=UPI0022375B6A|nr:hypothetical protein [Yersinia ruckeri]MCW6568288.1 hypothetical protein [Yersinia ruckeri]